MTTEDTSSNGGIDASPDAPEKEAGEQPIQAVDSARQKSPGEAIPYDFTGQDRIHRGQMPILETINDRFVRNLRHGLYHLLQCNIGVSSSELQTTKFGSYIHSVATPISLNIIRINPLPGTALIACDQKLIFSLVDLFFGGNGEYLKQENVTEFTRVESEVTQTILEQVFRDLKDAWEPVLVADFQLDKPSVSPQFANIANTSEPVVICNYRIGTNDIGGEIHLILPFSMLEPIHEKLTGGVQNNNSTEKGHWPRVLNEKMQEAQITVSGTLAESELNMREVLALKPGDIVPLDSPEQVILRAGEIFLCSGKFGVHNDKNSVQVTSKVNVTDYLSNSAICSAGEH